MRHLTSPAHSHSPALGPLLCDPHVYNPWTMDAVSNTLYHEELDGSYSVYTRNNHSSTTRGGLYTKSDCTEMLPAQVDLASVTKMDEETARLRSTVTIPRSIEKQTGFWKVLHELPNQTLWRHFHCDDDGAWIRRGATMGSLLLVHDGSYMQKVDPDVCSAAFKLVCTRSGKMASGSIVERSDQADNYRAEGLGALAGLLVIYAGTGRRLPYKFVKAYCDNKGIVIHGSSTKPLPDKQSQADILRLIKQYIHDLPVKVEYEHVFGHLDDVL